MATPCRHLAAAYAATAPNGEIYVLDPANYGSLTITGPVSIEGHGWASIAPVAGQAAITINASGATDKINIIGVVLDGTNIANTTGIAFNSGGNLTVRDSVIRNFTQDGIDFASGSSTLSQIYVSNTLVSDNGLIGIHIECFGTGTTYGVLHHVEVENNANNGVFITTTGAPTKVTVSDSVIANNASAGIAATYMANVMVRNSTIANNTNGGLDAEGLLAVAGLGRRRRLHSCYAINDYREMPAGGPMRTCGLVISYGDNNIDGNGAVNTEPPNPLTYK